MNAKTYRRWLLELTSLPTAAGREGRVIEWIERWVATRNDCRFTRDRFGNLVIRATNQNDRRGTASTRGRTRSGAPVYLTAHLDHPAFVVTAVTGRREVVADFRGGVDNAYFIGSRIALYRADAAPQVGRITELRPAAGGRSLDKSVTVRFTRDVRAEPGDVMTWNLPKARITGDRVVAPACDDLAGVAAALAAFDAILLEPRRPRRASAANAARAPRTVRLKEAPDVRLLLTRCEEVGFVGAIAACKAGTIPKNALVVALENSKSFAESPIGAGPIVRVGDRTSTFDPDLTYRVGKIAEALAAEDKTFKWQRKLMPGGTCEASAYQTYGHTATCVCLPLGNYHNMNEAKKKIDSEIISASDFDNLVKLLAALGRRLGDPDLAPPLKSRLDALFKSRQTLLR